MKKYKGLKVPCKPKKNWKYWMLHRFYSCRTADTAHCIRKGVDCEECIYDNIDNGEQRAQFYKDTFGEPKKLPKRDSQGKFCKEIPDKVSCEIKLTVSFSDILWDADDEPGSEFLETSMTKEIFVDEDIFDLEDYLSDYLSDEFGFCHWGFNYSILAIEFVK